MEHLIKEHALLHLGEHALSDALITLFEKYDFDYSLVGDADLNEALETLFTSNKENKPCESYPFDWILFYNIDHEKILSFYEEAEALGYLFDHKAVLTETNASWTLRTCLEENHKEHQLFVMYETLQDLLKEANAMNIEAFTKESFAPYRDAFIKAFMYVQEEHLDMQVMHDLIDDVILAKMQLVFKDEVEA